MFSASVALCATTPFLDRRTPPGRRNQNSCKRPCHRSPASRKPANWLCVSARAFRPSHLIPTPSSPSAHRRPPSKVSFPRLLSAELYLSTREATKDRAAPPRSRPGCSPLQTTQVVFRFLPRRWPEVRETPASQMPEHVEPTTAPQSRL